MRFGVQMPQFNDFGDAALLAEMAKEAEQAGWDGFFLWDHILFDDLARPMVDAWIALAAAALNTRTIRLGTLLTPIPRRRPWKLARETVTLDHLSGGRVILGAGLGDPVKWEYGFFHEETDAKIRAEKLDEGLAILNGLWSGKPFAYQGKHYQLEAMTFLPKPVQEPRIPVWLGGWWPNKPPARRAARWDGFFPLGPKGPLTPEDWTDILAFIAQYRQSDRPFDAANGGVTPGDQPGKAVDQVAPYAKAGVTWWIEDISPYSYGLAWDQPWTPDIVKRLRDRIRQGPPSL